MLDRKFSRLDLALAIVVFISMIIFHTVAHPITPYDGDDWLLLSGYRDWPFPQWKAANPSKVLPETFMPFVGNIAAYIVHPLTGDYLFSLTLTAAIVISAFITCYVMAFNCAVTNIIGLSRWQAACVSIMFLLLHFCIFKTSNSYENPYLFHSENFNCLFNYTIPVILNGTLVCLFVASSAKGSCIYEYSTLKTGVLSLMLFLAIFSNVLSSIVLSAWIVAELLLDISAFNREGLRQYIYNHRFKLIILFVWLLSLLFEANGGRAAQSLVSFWQMPEVIFKSMSFLGLILCQQTKGVKIFGIIFLFLAIPSFVSIYRKRDRKAEDNEYIRLVKTSLLAFFIWLCYELVLCAKASFTYIGRDDVMLGGFFFIFFLTFISFAYFLKNTPRFSIILPILVFIFLCRTLDGSNSLRPSTVGFVPEYTARAVSKDLIEQVISWTKTDTEAITLYIPVWQWDESVNNWPHYEPIVKNITNALYRHNIIHRLPKQLKAVRDPSLNKRYHLPLPEK